jgi:chemotaxis protein MotC
VKGFLPAFLAAALLFAPDTVFAESEETAHAPAAQPTDQPEPISIPAPVQMVRTLHLMQDQIAVGSTEAHLAQRGLLSILDERFMSFEPDVWTSDKAIRAAVSFVLSGGSPRILRKLLELGSSVVPKENTPLIEGALAYVEGREEAAQNDLLSIDPKSLPPTLGAQLAMVQSALAVRNNPAKSDELLDFVRLQVPGTLIEEAALRRQVFVASQTGNMKKFQALATDYLRRYRHSIYAGNFRQRLASALTRIDFGKDPVLFEGIVAMMSELDPEARRDLYLVAARASIEQGLTKSARLMAEKAQEISDQDKASAARARLYRAAAMIVSPETIQGAVSDLQSIDRSDLMASDLALLDSALAMADNIRKPPDRGASKVAEAKPTVSKIVTDPVADAAAQAQGPEQLQAISKARDALSRVDRLFKN